MKFLSALLLFITLSAHGTPILEMNKALGSFMTLLPYVLKDEDFKAKQNAPRISAELAKLEAALAQAGHDRLLKHDLFAPSYQLLVDNIKETKASFAENKKDYALWRMRETVSLCLDCHTRLPKDLTSSFQNGDLSVNTSALKDSYQRGLVNLLIRKYVDAKAEFERTIQDQLISKNPANLILPFQQILLIETKVLRDRENIRSYLADTVAKKKIPDQVARELNEWIKRLDLWEKEPALASPLKNEKELEQFIRRRLNPLRQESYEDAFIVDYLLSSGILAQYYFENQRSPSAPALNYWLGYLEKRLKMQDFLSSGDLFFKQCILRYPQSRMARECFKEYKESIEFDFSGSRGTEVPEDLQKELRKLGDKLKK